jgi:phosphatidylglycerol:prolipoprotein diacylglycerol transferase
VIILGLMVGARLGYVVFYNLSYFLKHPLEIFLPFEFSNGITFTGISGMSYHGGVIGILIAGWLYTRKNAIRLRDVADLYIPCIPLGYTFGRLGNFINGELYGRITTAPIGMYFPLSPQKALRHPSQLYEAFFEGIFLFVVLWAIRKVRAPRGAMLAFYLVGYGLVRFGIEFYREPDAHIGFVVGVFSMGQVLCAGMIAGGVLLFFFLRAADRRRP